MCWSDIRCSSPASPSAQESKSVKTSSSSFQRHDASRAFRYHHRHRYKSLSLLAQILLFSSASMLCVVFVQGFKPPSVPMPEFSLHADGGGDLSSPFQRTQIQQPSLALRAIATPKPDVNFLTTDSRTRQIFLATNTMQSANRFLQQANQHGGQPTQTPSAEPMLTFSRAATTPQTEVTTINPQFQPSTSAEHKLYETLFKRSLYQKNVRPVQNHLRSIKVRLGVCVMTIDEIIEKDQTMITSGCIKMKWSDEFLQWSPETFQNLTWLVMPSTEIWLPDIALVNSPDPYTITRKPAFAEVTNTGQVGYYPSGRFSTRCAISLLFFPFDIQKCELRFESWVYPTQWLHIEPWEQNPIDMKDFYRNHQWDLERVSAIPGNISYDGLDFSTMRFIFYFRRRSLYYSVLSIFPGVLMSILQMFSHTLPVEHPARMTLLTSLFVSTSVLQSSLASQMPKSSDGISLIQMYLMIFSSNLIISMVVTFINMHVWFRVPLAEVPNALRMLRSFLLDTGGTTGRPIEKPPPQEQKQSIDETAGASVQKFGNVLRSRKKGLSQQGSLETPQKEQGSQEAANEAANPEDAREDEETSLIVSYCCGAIKHRTSRRGRRYAGESSSAFMLRRRKPAQSKQQNEPGTSQEKAATPESSKAAAKKPLVAVVQSLQTQLTERKERWLRFSMKVDKAFLYAMAIFNTLCPITIFLVVPQFQSYNDGEN